MDLNIGQNKWEEIMSVKDTIKKSVLESGTFAQYDMLKIMLAMTIALIKKDSILLEQSLSLLT